MKTTDEAIDAKLGDVAIKQLLYKPSIMRNLMVTIVQSFLGNRIQWPDEIDLGEVGPQDKNCIGQAWRNLSRAGIIKQTPERRRSKNKASNGRQIYKYRLLSESAAKTFLARNGRTAHTVGQPNLL
jgi:hypothetical protein